MRPITRGKSPQPVDYGNYRNAFADLVSRLGPYCSYCERRMQTHLAVEHIQPTGLPAYASLEGRWDNFLLGCINCNSTKKDKDVVLASVVLPDRDNTAAAYDYTSDGKVSAGAGLSPVLAKMAAGTLSLCGLDKGPSQVKDENGQLVAIDRFNQRRETWGIALNSKDELRQSPTDNVRRLIVDLARNSGFFSIWMQVFDDDPDMRQRLIHAFPGTARDCFAPDTRLVTPRPANGLSAGGKC